MAMPLLSFGVGVGFEWGDWDGGCEGEAEDFEEEFVGEVCEGCLFAWWICMNGDGRVVGVVHVVVSKFDRQGRALEHVSEAMSKQFFGERGFTSDVGGCLIGQACHDG